VVLSPKAGRLDVALLGPGAGLTGVGELATVRFRVLAPGDPKIRIASADGRDGTNQKIVVARTVAVAAALPTVTRLTGAMPNPFSQTATLSFSLAKGGPVELAIYSVGGRRVRTLAHDVREPGAYSVVWNGRDDGGNAVAAGVYYAYLVTAQGRFHRTITYLK
jgi:flagellar hook assembly protein FlgD